MTASGPYQELRGRGIGLTGGGGHLGSSMALALARAGATVIVCGRQREPLETVAAKAKDGGYSGTIIPVSADVSTDAGVTQTLDAIERAAGRVSGWVNNAAVARPGALLELQRDDVTASLANTLGDTIMATSLAARRMTEHGGVIVNVASMYGVVSPDPGTYENHPAFHNPPTYGAAKAGVIQFTRYAAVHLAPHGIRVNAISPGAFPGPVAQAEPDFVEELKRRSPSGRIGAPHELDGAITFLLSDASSYVTGHNLIVDGGWTAW